MHLPNLVGVVGQFGSGKTLYMLQAGLQLCEQFHKPLISNFPLDHSAIRAYCRLAGLSWCAGNLRIIHVDVLAHGLMVLFSRRNSVVLFDEAGVFANSRAWSKMPQEFLAHLFQIRHLNIHMLVAFHFIDQIDKQLRLVFQHWIYCKALSTFDRRLNSGQGGPRILVRLAYHYKPDKFLLFLEDPKLRANFFRSWMSAKIVFWRVLPFSYLYSEFRNLFLAFYSVFSSRKFRPYSSPESLLFRAYDSFGDDLGLRRSRRPLRQILQFGPDEFPAFPSS